VLSCPSCKTGSGVVWGPGVGVLLWGLLCRWQVGQRVSSSWEEECYLAGFATQGGENARVNCWNIVPKNEPCAEVAPAAAADEMGWPA